MVRDGFRLEALQGNDLRPIVSHWQDSGGWEILMLSWTDRYHQLVYLGVDNSTPLV
jgi:hypothetical protein